MSNLVEKLEAEGAFTTFAGRAVVHWPKQSPSGFLSAHHLQKIADELDRRNAACEKLMKEETRE